MSPFAKKIKKQWMVKNQKNHGRTIGIIGVGAGTGVTHLAVWTGNYLTGVRRETTAVLEWNDHQDFQNMQFFCTHELSERKPFRVLNVDYYSQADAETLASCMNKNYQRIILDFGEITRDRLCDCARCDRKIMVGALSEWQAKGFLDFMKMEGKRDESWSYTIAFGSEETRRKVEKTFDRKLLRIPVSVDSFVVTRTDMNFFVTLLGE